MYGAKLATGIGPLDRDIGGGIRGGSIALLSSPPEIPTELVLAGIADTRPTLYLTLTRSGDGIEASIDSSSELFVSQVREEESEPMDMATKCLQRVKQLCDRIDDNNSFNPNEYNIIIDGIEVIEEGGQEVITTFFGKLRQIIDEIGTDGIVILNGIQGDFSPPARELTTSLSDVVLQLNMVVDGEELTYRLFMPKNRGGTAMMDGYKLQLERNLDVDTSRDI